MADTINELYSKYTEGVEYALEDDRYFQYLFEMIQAGDNTLEQKNRILHKVVDERWLTVVEEGIEAIFNIVDNSSLISDITNNHFMLSQRCLHLSDKLIEYLSACSLYLILLKYLCFVQ